MDFKEILSNDVKNTFINQAEFAEIHIINGEKISLLIDENVVDNDVQLKISNQVDRQGNGLYGGVIAIYVSSDDFGKPKPGSYIELDSRKYTVITTTEESGIYRIIVKRTGGR